MNKTIAKIFGFKTALKMSVGQVDKANSKVFKAGEALVKAKEAKKTLLDALDKDVSAMKETKEVILSGISAVTEKKVAELQAKIDKENSKLQLKVGNASKAIDEEIANKEKLLVEFAVA